MEYPTAPMSPAIKISTGMVLAMNLGFFVAAIWAEVFLLGGLLLAAVTFFCYRCAPVAYELRSDRLIVRFRRGEKEFSPVRRCSTLTERLPFGLRLWGNGGLFAATGIFWNRALGVFRAYVTSCRYQDMVMVETTRQRIIISPEDPDQFVKEWEGQAS
jgi:Bacterial PH domain